MLDHLKRALRRHGPKLERTLQDGGYQSREMATKVEELGGEPLIKVKKNVSFRAKGHPEGFKAIYCYRVVIEGIISALKRIFGYRIASKKRHNQNLEVLCRLVLWNYGGSIQRNLRSTRVRLLCGMNRNLCEAVCPWAHRDVRWENLSEIGGL